MISKKVLIFTDCYIYGGSERLMSFLMGNEYLQSNFKLKLAYRRHASYERGMQLDYLSIDKSSLLPQRLLSNETLFYRINCLDLPKIFTVLIKLPFYLLEKLKLYTLWNLGVFFFLLRRQKPDILHINNGGYPAAKSCNCLVLANHLFWGANVVYQVNNQATLPNKFELMFDRFVSRNVDSFLTASNLAKAKLIENRGFAGENIKVINNCVVPALITKSRAELAAELSIPETNFILTQVGFLTKRKGQSTMLHALAMLFERDESLKIHTSLILVGNGEDETLLLDLVKELKLDNNVFFVGYRANSQDYINACDVFLLPSISNEDMPLVLLTALQLGKPIIASNFAGISQAIQSGSNGILIDINDLSGFERRLGEAIYGLYSDSDKRKQLSENAKQSFELYSPERYGKNIAEIYCELKAR